jgi:predicted hotdog family 3-hydroxylacyl-ACP dehydratase
VSAVFKADYGKSSLPHGECFWCIDTVKFLDEELYICSLSFENCTPFLRQKGTSVPTIVCIEACAQAGALISTHLKPAKAAEKRLGYLVKVRQFHSTKNSFCLKSGAELDLCIHGDSGGILDLSCGLKIDGQIIAKATILVLERGNND